MNLFEKKRLEKKEYVDFFKDYIDNVLGDNIPKDVNPKVVSDFIDEIKNASKSELDECLEELGFEFNDLLLSLYYLKFALEYALPLCAAMLFLFITDFIFKDEKCLKEIFSQPLDDLPDWKYVYDVLSKLPFQLSKYYIVQLECTNEQHFSLVKALSDKNSEDFVSIINKMGKESWPIKHIADIYNLFLSSVRLGREYANDTSNGQDATFSEYLYANMPSIIKKGKFSTYLKYKEKYGFMTNYIAQVEFIKWDNVKNFYQHIMCTYLDYSEIFRLEKENLYPEVQELLSQFIIDPEQIEFYQELKKRDITFNIAINNDNSSIDDTEYKTANLLGKDVFLPADFFKIQNRISRSSRNRRGFEKAIGVIANKYTDKIENAVPKFCELINFLAERKYIKNDLVVKKDFASKMTGYYPEFNQLEKIDWFGDTNVLSVLIQNLPSSENKWERAKKLFNLENKLYNSSTLRKNNPDDQDFADKFEEIYGVNLRE